MVVEVDDEATWKDAYARVVNNGLLDNKDPHRDEWVMSLSDDLKEARAALSEGEMDICVTFFDA